MTNTENKNIEKILPEKEQLTESEAMKVTGGSIIDDIIDFFSPSKADSTETKAVSPGIGDPGNGGYFK